MVEESNFYVVYLGSEYFKAYYRLFVEEFLVVIFFCFSISNVRIFNIWKRKDRIDMFYSC